MKKIFLILAFACIMSGCACHEQTDEPEQQKKIFFPMILPLHILVRREPIPMKPAICFLPDRGAVFPLIQ